MKILHLEDSELDHQLVCRALNAAKLDYDITRVETIEGFQTATSQTDFDIILADYRLPGFTALDAWSHLQLRPTPPPFILLSGAIGEAAAVGAIHQGISDYLHKDNLPQLERVIRRAMEVSQAKAAQVKASLELAASERRLLEFNEYLQVAIEGERAAIAREIHDDIGGSLAAVKLDLSWISRHSSDAALNTHLSTALEMLQHAIGASQRIMMNLRPAILDQGLLAAVQWLASSFERRTGTPVKLRSALGAAAPTKAIELTAYRVVQEALTNISKYAQCGQVQIDLSDGNGVLTVEVSDNGGGIAASALDNPKAFGIRGLQERAKSVGGWLDVSTQLGRGTSIILSVPLDTPEANCRQEIPE